MNQHTIMVVDDNAATRRMVRNALSRQGYHVIEAPDGATARSLMVSEQPRLVLQDLMLPDADGFSLVGELRRLAGPDVAILAFSGFVSKLDQARISSVGFDDIIPKPIAPSRLLPLLEAHMPGPLPKEERFGQGRRLVIADDDPLQLKLASFRLGRLGFEIETAPDGAAALAAARRRRPDAVVSDVMMPELDGFGLAMALRQDASLASVPLLLVTSSYVEPSDRELAQRAGANDLVVRTPALDELIELLRRTLTSTAKAAQIDRPELDELDELERERNRRVFRQLERQVLLNTGLAKRCSALASELTVLTGIAEAVVKHRDVDSALDEALAACFDAGGVSVGALYLLEPTGGLRVRTLGSDGTWHAGGIETFFDNETLLRSVMTSGTPLHVPSADLPRDVCGRLLEQCEASALLVVPLTSANGPLGALLMVARGRELDEEDWRQFALGVGTQISQVLTLARAYADVEAAERRAADHAALLEAVVTSAPDFVIQLDREGTIRFINRVDPPRVPADLLGRNWFEMVAPDQRDKALAAFDRALAGVPSEFEIQAIRNTGAHSWFQGRIGPIRRDGVVTGAVMVARDITDKKQTEMQLMLADRMASVGTLAAGVAHEINNPLAAVIANLDMALEDTVQLETRAELPPDLLDELRDARMSADRVREIVRDLKMFSRTQEERYGAVNVEKVLESTLRMAWNEVRHRARVVKEYGNVPRVTANESRLGQVLLNLIVNAVQAIPEGNYLNNEIRIRTYVDRDYVVIGIRDTGTGIPADVQRRLFTPFFTTKPVGVGTGLGLAISHRIVTAMNGTITFDSEVGKGTEFRIALPIAAATVPPVTQKLPLAAAPARRGRVLVIDDEESLGQAIRRYLAQEHDVEAVTSARVALDLLAGGARYDVILCDLMMPQITGMEVHDAVAKLDPAQAGRIVFVTGGAFTEAARTFFEATPNQRIEKPFDLKTLRNLVNDLIR